MRSAITTLSSTISRTAIISAAMLSLAACGSQEPPAMPPTEVGYISLVEEPVTLSTELTGRTAAFRVSEVRPQVTGLIHKQLYREGSVVRAGQSLYQIDPSLYRASYNQSMAQLTSAQAAAVAAQAKARRYQGLTDIEAVSLQERDDAVSTARQAAASIGVAKANLDTARVNLRFTQVLAPITGRIGRSNFTEGALVTASQTDALASIQQLDPMYVDITQSSSQLLELRRRLAKGDALPTSTAVSLKLEDGSDYPLKGNVQFSEPVVDAATGAVTIRATFPNPDAILLPGLFVRAVMPQAMLPKAILVPQQGIQRAPDGSATALVVDKDNKVVERTVMLDQAIGDKWLVKSGLKVGDHLIVEGTARVRAGDTVKPVLVAKNAATKPAATQTKDAARAQ